MDEKKQSRKSQKADTSQQKSRGTTGSMKIDDLEVRKSTAAEVRGGNMTKTLLSGPYNDRSGDIATCTGDPAA